MWNGIEVCVKRLLSYIVIEKTKRIDNKVRNFTCSVFSMID